MAKPGIKILRETIGTGYEVRRGDRVRITFDIQLNRGDYISRNRVSELTLYDREFIAGLRYALEGMRIGGTRVVQASPHLCFGNRPGGLVPADAVLIFHIHSMELIAKSDQSLTSPK